MIGEKLLHYEITEKLGEGGMGVVYRARDTHLDRWVALKVLPPEKVADPNRKARFIQEAKAASALHHANIVTIHDIAADRGIDFIAMEYVAGKTLDQLIPRKGLHLNETLKLALQIAGALARAHTAGIVHRDLKPANVMVDDHGGVKLLDFGLAKLVEPGSSSDVTTATIAAKTEEGKVVGTVAYMSPEQAQDHALDARTDIFSFGAVLYEMLAGHRAFQGTSIILVLAAVLQEEPAPLPAETPPDLAKIVHRCLRKDPERRFQHMDDVKVALEDVKEDSDSGKLAVAAARQSGKLRTLTWGVAAGAVVALLAVAGWYLQPRPAPPAPTAAAPSAPPLRAVPLTANPGYELDPCFSPDGRHVAFAWDGPKQDNLDIYVKPIGPGDLIQLTTDAAHDRAPAWSPDGHWIAFLRIESWSEPAAVLIKPALGGPERKIGEIGVSREYLGLNGPLTWTKDSKGLVACHAGGLNEDPGLFLISTESAEKRRLTSDSAHAPAFSPDGRRLVYVAISGMSVCDLYLLKISDDLTPQGGPTRLTELKEAVASPAWTADGREIMFSTGGHLAARSLWRITASPGNTPRKETVGEDSRRVTVSPVGRRLVYSKGSFDVDIWRLEVRNRTEVVGAPTKLISSTRVDCNPQYSPNGKRIAFNSQRSGFEEIWVANADGSDAIPLTKAGGPMVADPRWSPDSQDLVIHSEQGGRGIDVIGANGGALKRMVTGGGAWPTWSRDGRWIYYGK